MNNGGDGMFSSQQFSKMYYSIHLIVIIGSWIVMRRRQFTNYYLPNIRRQQ